jgi:hypothetical protein
MRVIHRIVSLALLGALSILISGCAAMNTPSFDPTDWLDFLDSKKRAVGDRHPVFPNGVPGVAQGVPPDLLKGTPEHQAALAAADPSLAPPPVLEAQAPPPKPAKKRVASRPTPIRVTPNGGDPQAEPANDPSASPDSEEPPPASPPPPRKRAARRSADPSAADQLQPAAQQQSQSISNAPTLQSGSFQR